MSKTIQLQGTKPDDKPINVILSGDTLQIGGTRYRLNAFDHTTLAIWVDDTRHYYKEVKL